MLQAIITRFTTGLIIILAFVGGMLSFVLHNKTIDFSPLECYNPGKPTIVLDDEGHEWARFQLDRRDPIVIEHIPQHVIHAFLAAEDHAFFSHSGISWKGIVRSSLINLYKRRIVQGASTITQQLVKLLFFDSKKTFKRKVLEQCYALLVERQFTKKQILEIYLNHVYFGSGIYGVEAACQRFWGTSVRDISIDQAALLAAIVKSPVRYNPITYPVSAQKRRNIVLSVMARLHFITADVCEKAHYKNLAIRELGTNQRAPHLKETIRQFLEERFGRTQMYTGGLNVQTTLNIKMQDLAQESFSERFIHLRKTIGTNVDGALVSLDVKTGAIKALIGGVDFNQSKFNRAFQARRQMGSIFKPVIYAAALESGKTFASTEIDERLIIENNDQIWKPQNVTKRFDGCMTLARALAYSNNIVTIKTLLNIGCEHVVQLGKKFRIPGLQPYPSIALGCVDITLKEAVGSFNVFANNGVYVEPHYLVWIKDKWGKKIYRNEYGKERVISARVSGQVAKVLGIGMERKRKIQPHTWITCEGIGKTGTTNDCRTSWFSGSTPTITTSIYVGRDDNKPMGTRVYATKTAFPIWLRLHRALESPQKTFSYDPSLQELYVHSKTGQLSDDPDDEEVYTILV